jgi:hypothetical protein
MVENQELQPPSTDTGTVIPRAGRIEGDFFDQATADGGAGLQIQLRMSKRPALASY